MIIARRVCHRSGRRLGNKTLRLLHPQLPGDELREQTIAHCAKVAALSRTGLLSREERHHPLFECPQARRVRNEKLKGGAEQCEGEILDPRSAVLELKKLIV